MGQIAQESVKAVQKVSYSQIIVFTRHCRTGDSSPKFGLCPKEKSNKRHFNGNIERYAQYSIVINRLPPQRVSSLPSSPPQKKKKFTCLPKLCLVFDDN